MFNIREKIKLGKISRFIRNFHKMRYGPKIVYVDLDGVVVDFQSGIDQLDEQTKKIFEGQYDDVPNIYSRMEPIAGAVDAVKKLATKYDVYFLSTAPWGNPSAWSDKVNWVSQYLGEYGYKRLILSHHKNLNNGHYLIDDRPRSNGADNFEGKVINFGSDDFPNWDKVLAKLL